MIMADLAPRVELTLDNLSYGGDAVGRTEGKVVFAAYGLPGERVRVSLSEQKKNFARGAVSEVLGEPSPERVQPRCEYFGKCGGCQWQHMGYDYQLASKSKLLAEQLRRVAGLEMQPEAPIAAPDPWAYRNLARFQVSYPEIGSGEVGYYRRESHSIVAIERCYIVHPRIVSMIELIDRFVRVMPHGALSAITVRVSFADESSYLLLHQGTTTVNMGDVRRMLTEWVKREQVAERYGLRGIATLPPAARQRGRDSQPQPGDIGGEGGEVAEVSAYVLWGKGDFSEQVAGRTFQLAPAGFFQVSSQAAGELVRTVNALVGKVDTVLDLYSGVGLFGLSLLAEKQVRRAVGIELQTEAVKAARENADALKVGSQAVFQIGRVEDVLPDLLADGLQAEAIIVDPPRSGLAPTALQALAEVPAERLVYVSCDPSTLARDVAALAPLYRLRSTRVVDLFPQTYHIESVSLLERI